MTVSGVGGAEKYVAPKKNYCAAVTVPIAERRSLSS